MTSSTRLQNEYSPSTSNSSSLSDFNLPQGATTRRPPVWLVESRDVQAPRRAGFIDIDDYVAQLETDPVQAADLAHARKQFAASIYGDQDLTISALRLRAGMSQATLAKALHTSQAHVSRIEHDKCGIMLDTAERLAQLLGVDMNTLTKALAKSI